MLKRNECPYCSQMQAKRFECLLLVLPRLQTFKPARNRLEVQLFKLRRLNTGMSTSYNAQINNAEGKYSIQFETFMIISNWLKKLAKKQ